MAEGAAPRFVVQEHHARSLHWDFRLERGGVLVSWAVPKGVPPDPAVNHLAVPTEDHPLSYFDFEGDIPKGNYGAGHVSVWDHGTYECEKWERAEVMVVLHGRRVEGRYVLFRTGAKAWMIHRMDPPQDPDWQPLPGAVEPMVGTVGSLPAGPGGEWAYEVLWEGQRVQAWSDGGRLVLRDAKGVDVTAKWPDVRALGPALGAHQVVLDGVVTAPTTLVVFDIVHLDGHDLRSQPYEERRRRLAELGLAGPAWVVPTHHVGDGPALFDVVVARDLPGVMAKRLSSGYHPGPSPDWVEVRATAAP